MRLAAIGAPVVMTRRAVEPVSKVKNNSVLRQLEGTVVVIVCKI
jgi:hypothetical protein